MGMIAPRKLSIHPISPSYDKEAVKMVDKVFVDDVHIPNCVAYDMDAGWAFGKENGSWMPRKYGVVTVKMKG
jgi:hypothetical protein